MNLTDYLPLCSSGVVTTRFHVIMYRQLKKKIHADGMGEVRELPL